METIALFGGSFDPPHIGHRAVIEAVLGLHIVDKLVLMPTYLNPFKHSSYASGEQRVRWLKQIFASYPRIIVDSFEVDKARKVPTIESVEYLLTKYKKIYLVIGADNLASLDQWYRYEELNKLVTFIVASRDAIEIPDTFIQVDIDLDISSTSLRAQMKPENVPKQCAVEITQFYKENNGK